MALVKDEFSEQLSFSRDFSSGFAPDRDYRNLTFTSLSHLVSPLGPTDVTLAYMDHLFGANGFYGPYNSWENTKTWFAAIRQALAKKTEVSFLSGGIATCLFCFAIIPPTIQTITPSKPTTRHRSAEGKIFDQH